MTTKKKTYKKPTVVAKQGDTGKLNVSEVRTPKQKRNC